MDRHTFIGKCKVCSTDVCDFTDYQGIGRDPLYKRYESVYNIIKKVINPRYVNFLAAPDYSAKNDAVNWYIDEWSEIPEVLTNLQGDKYEKYRRIKEETVAHYKQALNNLSGEELQVMACALRYIDDDFIFCCDDKVFVVAWGMTPDLRKHISTGELVHEAPAILKFKLTFDVGEHGRLMTKQSGLVTLLQGSEITDNDVPKVEAVDGYVFAGWTPNPVGCEVKSDMTFVALYDEVHTVPYPPEPPKPEYVICRFEAGEHGVMTGQSEIEKNVGSRILPADIPQVTPNKGYVFKGWDINPINLLVQDDTLFRAVYEKKLPWYKRWWRWMTGSGFLKWLLWGLLILLVAWLLTLLLKDCHGCSRDKVNAVEDIDHIVNPDGETIDDNGVIDPIDLDDGKLPDEQSIVAPVMEDGGELPPIVRDPRVPPVIANRLFLFLENEDDDVDALAADFKEAYPGSQYSIIGFDRDVKSILISVPEDERDDIRRTINSKIPNHQFIVFDEEIYEINEDTGKKSTSTPGWHINAVKAREGWKITQGSPTVIVAVVDDGIDASHPMFNGRIINAYNVYTRNNKLSKGQGHGTHTAGLAVGSLDYLNQGAAGIAPGCKLMPIQVFDNKQCPLSALVSGVMYAVHKGADVVNISIGPKFSGLNQLPVGLQNEIAQTQFKNVEKLWNRVCRLAAKKNTILVFSAGNDTILSSIPPENRTSTAITVGAVDQKLYPTDFTNYGPCTDISAPGKGIYSAFPDGGFTSSDGTSMAAPIVSGTIALMKSLKKDLTVAQARNVLYRTGCDVYGPMPPMVQVNLALEAVKNGDFSEPPVRPMRPIPVADADTPALPIEPIAEAVVVVPDDPGIVNPRPGGEVVVPVSENESNYEAIRRLIEEYKRKIAELEEQLPENKRK